VKGLEFHKYYFDLFKDESADPANVTVSSPDVRISGDMAVIAYVRLTQRGTETSCTPETRVW